MVALRMIKVLATADLHGYQPDIPECDILILAGDYLASGSWARQLQDGVPPLKYWLQGLKAKEIVAIGGNHDWFLQNAATGTLGAFRWHLLQDSGIELFGLKIWGSPWTLPFYSWAYMAEEEELQAHYAKIPKDTHILVTHGPPYGVLDENQEGQKCGSKALRAALHIVQPAVHIFGHIHEQYGRHDLGRTQCVNVSHVDARYRPVNPVVEIK